MRNRGLSDGERELLNRIISEERPRRSYAEDAPVADAQPEGESLSRFKAGYCRGVVLRVLLHMLEVGSQLDIL